MSTTIQFSVLTRDPHFAATLDFIRQHQLAHELHINRTRFWIPPGTVLTEFYLRFDTYHIVLDTEDLATGRSDSAI